MTASNLSADVEPESNDSEEEHLKICERFEDLKLQPEIMRGVQEAGFTSCTPIQSRVLPYSLEGQDIVGKAQTGTGKTAAFLLTIFKHLLSQKAAGGHRGQASSPRALVMAPTRELALQICQDADRLGKFTGIRFAAIFGGVSYDEQLDQLRKNVDAVVATPGRLIDLFKNRQIHFGSVQILVIDEADRMFDMGFYPDIKYILRKLPNYDRRQTLLFSATLSYRVTELCYEFMNQALEVNIAPEKITAENVQERLYHVGMDEKLPLLLGVLKREEITKVLIFCNMKSASEWLGFKLTGNGIACAVLTGDASQKRRLSIVRQLKSGELKVVVATDIASRGLHVDDVSHVINYDIPEDPENYVHRIGRTARAGKSGQAVSLACERYVTGLPLIEEYIGHKISVIAIKDEDLFADQAGPYHRPRPQHFDRSPGGRGRQGSGGGHPRPRNPRGRPPPGRNNRRSR